MNREEIRSSCAGRFFSAKTKQTAWEIRASEQHMTVQCTTNHGATTRFTIKISQAQELVGFLSEVLSALEKDDDRR